MEDRDRDANADFNNPSHTYYFSLIKPNIYVYRHTYNYLSCYNELGEFIVAYINNITKIFPESFH